jgi:hypothetical protein
MGVTHEMCNGCWRWRENEVCRSGGLFIPYGRGFVRGRSNCSQCELSVKCKITVRMVGCDWSDFKCQQARVPLSFAVATCRASNGIPATIRGLNPSFKCPFIWLCTKLHPPSHRPPKNGGDDCEATRLRIVQAHRQHQIHGAWVR